MNEQSRRRTLRRYALWTAAVGIGGLLLIQAVPYGRAHDNPTPSREARWPGARAQTLFGSACADCHSDHTDWRWYSNVAPASWLVQHDVDDARAGLNVSEWDRPQPDVSEVVAQIDSGGMPPLQYTLGHPSARLSGAERRELSAGVQALYAADPPP
jgi:Haem-binding domain